jgi:predicted nucleic acid-binding protein
VFVALATILDMIFITADKRLADGLASLPAVKFLGELDIEFLTSP